ncbi:class II fructose-bisphosphate aldolase [uncultured Enorma sp.]|uniref:class II fructose-bisphosphate aldolase n=1 Tax=uncultured Enorma sp. TaxID=1714346 RepID=UPI0025927FAB|nr:class II fructose-bisphosphate aldolase [uncultured Enorma sp.]
MALVKVNDLLRHATEHHYGVPAINTFNFETIKYIVAGAEQEHMPVIVQFFPGFYQYIPLKLVSAIACHYAEQASVPVAVHLDHSAGYDIAVGGIRDGFPSVMVDGSSLPYEENVALTKAVAEVGRVFDVDIEAELGHVGNGSNEADFVGSDMYTDPAQAAEFVERTGCGSLAIAVGNAHGPYVKTPHLDMERIKEVRAAVSIPLVMHGCSDIPDEQLQETVNLGMSKYNIATEYFRAMYKSIEKNVADGTYDEDAFGLMRAAGEDMTAFVASKIRLLNPNNYSLA